MTTNNIGFTTKCETQSFLGFKNVNNAKSMGMSMVIVAIRLPHPSHCLARGHMHILQLEHCQAQGSPHMQLMVHAQHL